MIKYLKINAYLSGYFDIFFGEYVCVYFFYKFKYINYDPECFIKFLFIYDTKLNFCKYFLDYFIIFLYWMTYI